MNRAPLIIAIVLLLLPVLYVGSYLALVVPAGFFTARSGTARTEYYRVENDSCAQVFWPLEQLDRKLRPGGWGEDFDRVGFR